MGRGHWWALSDPAPVCTQPLLTSLHLHWTLKRCAGMSAFYIDVPLAAEEAAPVINRALELGVTHLDTAA